jgi:hypothetical protein
MKRVTWTILAAAMSAAAAALAARAARAIWSSATGERPPQVPWWGRLLVAGPVTAGVSKAINPHPQAS